MIGVQLFHVPTQRRRNVASCLLLVMTVAAAAAIGLALRRENRPAPP
jgi:hypothetical protein